MKILFCTNLPAPYRVDFFGELGKYCNLTVCYERNRASDRDVNWKSTSKNTFSEQYLNLIPVGDDRSRGGALRQFIASNRYDIVIFTNYVSPATIEAIIYCRIMRINYWVEYDGGFNKTDSIPLRLIKEFLLKGAEKHLTTCDEHIKYLQSLGIKRDRIHKYPFTSVLDSDLEDYTAVLNKKRVLKEKLGLNERKTVISVGQFIYRKGFDILIAAVNELADISLVIIGGEPTDEYIRMIDESKTDSIKFIPFMSKQELAEYYIASDLFVLPTREDIWGLVVNEAMSYGLPVITTNRCIAGLELICDGENGFIVPSEDIYALRSRIIEILSDDDLRIRMGKKSRGIIENYTIEKMVKRHMEIIEDSVGV